MNTLAEQVLAAGLTSGFAGSAGPKTVRRGPFTLLGTEVSSPESDSVYNDHWIVKRVGGGQEISRARDDMATRVYAGGIVRPDILKSLGISENQVFSYLKSTLSQVAGSTRLHEQVVHESDGDWQYRYDVTAEYPDIPMTVGTETVTYKGRVVFVHVFLIAPIA